MHSKKRILVHVLVLLITVVALFAAVELVMRLLYPVPEYSGRLWRREGNAAKWSTSVSPA